MTIGYNKPLYILPYDHRSSFEKGLYGWSGKLTAEQTDRIAKTKEVIYDAFKAALGKGLSKDRAGILVDEQFGAAILRDAAKNGFITAMPAEKSGQEEFGFEYGDAWAAHIEAFKPTFVKVLVRYNPEADEAMNRRQAARLKQLADYCHAHGHYFMFELLVPATHEQLDRLDGDQHLYDVELRPSLMIATIKELQTAGVEPDVWKIEGLDHRADCAKIAEVARHDGRDTVGCIILGRGSNDQKVEEWLGNASGVPGFIGFAVGRTSFWDPLVALRDGKMSRDNAVAEIARRYLEWVSVFEKPAAR
ncbi:MAG: 2-deoxy-5-keto-D-gluconate 6-phosphate aldolase domain-containing protein [Candidatus Binataceae bacterium]